MGNYPTSEPTEDFFDSTFLSNDPTSDPTNVIICDCSLGTDAVNGGCQNGQICYQTASSSITGCGVCALPATTKPSVSPTSDVVAGNGANNVDVMVAIAFVMGIFGWMHM